MTSDPHMVRSTLNPNDWRWAPMTYDPQPAAGTRAAVVTNQARDADAHPDKWSPAELRSLERSLRAHTATTRHTPTAQSTEGNPCTP